MCWNDEENLDFMGVENVTRLQFINQFNEELELHIMRVPCRCLHESDNIPAVGFSEITGTPSRPGII